MFKKTLVGIDFSRASAAVLSCLPHLQRVGVQQVVLGHIVYVANTPGLEQLLMDEARPLLAGQARALRQSGLQVTTEMRLGVPAVALADLAEEMDADLIVVGSNGRGALSRILLGSVAGGVLHNTRRPVLLVRMQICETEAGVQCSAVCDNLFGRVLFPTDFSDAGALAFHYLENLVESTHSAVTLLHVQDQVRLAHQMNRLDEFNEIDRERLEDLKTRLVALGGARVDLKIPLGLPTKLIVQEAGAGEATLVLMGTRGRGALAEVMVGSVAANVARLSPLPVLFVPTQV
jgi:nucleotide-binding universal stress UspA family protein